MTKDVWDWDIVIMHGSVKIIGRSGEHLDDCVFQQFGAKCHCLDEPTVSSPILNILGNPMRDSAYQGEPLTGEARPLLDADNGSQIVVKSGKTYRLRGPRKEHDGYSSGSIWVVYAEDPQPSRWQRFLSWLRGNP
jgi:hypothetical protein